MTTQRPGAPGTPAGDAGGVPLTVGRPQAASEVVARFTVDEHRALSVITAEYLGRMKSRGGVPTTVEAAAVRALLTAASDIGSKLDSPGTADAPSVCTTSEAATQLGISTRAVRLAIASGALAARRPAGGGPYVITESAIAAYGRIRAARSG